MSLSHDPKKKKQSSTSSANPFFKKKSDHDYFFNPDPNTNVQGKFFGGQDSLRGVGNQKPFFNPPIQAKLTIGEPGDKYEQEADRVASEVVEEINTPTNRQSIQEQSVQRMVEEGGLRMKPMPAITEEEAMAEDGDLRMKPKVQSREAIGEGEASRELSSEINRARGGGQPLDVGMQHSMGSAMGADFRGVRVHTDSQADLLNRSISARAFTTGQDLFFKKGEYQPGVRSGQELIAHELTHVMQQEPVKGEVIQRVTDEPASPREEEMKRTMEGINKQVNNNRSGIEKIVASVVENISELKIVKGLVGDNQDDIDSLISKMEELEGRVGQEMKFVERGREG